MKHNQFDSLARMIASRKTRRSILIGSALAGAVSALSGGERTKAGPPPHVVICRKTGNRDRPYKIIRVPEQALEGQLRTGAFEAFSCAGEWQCEPCPLCETKPIVNCGPGLECPTGETVFCPGGPHDPTSSDQAKAACEACFGAGMCSLLTIDCSGNGWTESFDPNVEPFGSPVFGYQSSTSCSGPLQPPGRVYFAGASDPVSDFGRWGVEICE